MNNVIDFNECKIDNEDVWKLTPEEEALMEKIEKDCAEMGSDATPFVKAVAGIELSNYDRNVLAENTGCYEEVLEMLNDI